MSPWLSWTKWPVADPKSWPKSAGDELAEDVERYGLELKRDRRSPLFYGIVALVLLAALGLLLLLAIGFLFAWMYAG